MEEFSISMDNQKGSLPHGEPSQNLESSSVGNICTHNAIEFGTCLKCGLKIEDKPGVAKDTATKNLLHSRKLCLVLDLDLTLLNSVRTRNITVEERYLIEQCTLPDAWKSSLFKLEGLPQMTKLRPYVHTFLQEASKLFEMYIYTMGTRKYATEIAKLLDPCDIYFSSRIIAKEDSTRKDQKGLDVVLWKESAVLIVDDNASVWAKHKENLILIEKYHFFASGRKGFGCKIKPLSELREDETETGGPLVNILKVLQRIHSLFFDSERTDNLEDRDVRQVLKTVRKEVLNGCKLLFSRIVPAHCPSKFQLLWKMAEQLGATCSISPVPSVTHVVSVDSKTVAARWALQEKKFLVNPKWIEAANCSWKKPREENFPVTQVKNKLPTHLKS